MAAWLWPAAIVYQLLVCSPSASCLPLTAAPGSFAKVTSILLVVDSVIKTQQSLCVGPWTSQSLVRPVHHSSFLVLNPALKAVPEVLVCFRGLLLL